MKKNKSIVAVLAFLSSLSFCFAATTQSPMIQPCTYEVLKVNFHAHTTYSDGTYTPAQLVDIYTDAGYDVLAITDHCTLAGCAEAVSEGEKTGLTVICGEEVTCSWADGSYKHILALFINQSVGFAEGSDLDITTIFDSIHAQTGIGIVAHPWLSWNNWQNYKDEPYIDGWEVDYSMAWTLESGYIYLFGHDFHNETFLEGISDYWTYLLAENRTEAGVKEALMEKRIVICGNGTLYGSGYALNLYAQNQRIETPSPAPTPTPSPTPTVTPNTTFAPTHTPTSTPSSSAEIDPTPEPTETGTKVIPPEAVYAVAVLGVSTVAAIVIATLKKRRNNKNILAKPHFSSALEGKKMN
jgi:PHP domain